MKGLIDGALSSPGTGGGCFYVFFLTEPDFGSSRLLVVRKGLWAVLTRSAPWSWRSCVCKRLCAHTSVYTQGYPPVSTRTATLAHRNTRTGSLGGLGRDRKGGLVCVQKA